MADLFGRNKVKELAEAIETASVASKIEILKTWHHDLHHGSLMTDKETSREQQYNQDIFKTVLGYVEKPASPHTLIPKDSTAYGQYPDLVLGCFASSAATQDVTAVVELKGAAIDLDRPQRREGNLSPIQQGFKYKPQYRNCPFVIVSNFREFRLYNDNQRDFERWTLDDLVSPANDYLNFKRWYVLVCAENLVGPNGQSKTERLLNEIRIEQERIGKRFYDQYKQIRLDLLRDLYRHNVAIQENIDLGIEKAQKLIDRVVFCCFAEDRNLLPDNTLATVLSYSDRGFNNLWDDLQSFFKAVDKGSEKLGIPKGYNGGLFHDDPVLNGLKISEDTLRALLAISGYNFAVDLSVTILGHIFEQSITDLEEIRNKVAASNSLEGIDMSRRKKDGIFYTPDYVVANIVDSTLGEYLRENETRCAQQAGLHEDILDKTYAQRELVAYTAYRECLNTVTVVDCAAGSGAFLVHVFDVLMAEHQRVGLILGDLFSQTQYVNHVLKNNIFGVDLNEESVEITKLSLWLKSAARNEKLTSLDDNIKTGNSIFSDPSVAGDKAFNWNEEFPEVFRNGGFDVVVSNPPYGAKLSKREMDYLKLKIKPEVLNVRLTDTYFAFYVIALERLLKAQGLLGFIAPNTWCLTRDAAPFRKFLLASDFTVESIIQHQEKVFPEATVDTNTVIVRASTPQPKQLTTVAIKNRMEPIYESKLPQSDLAAMIAINVEMTTSDIALVKKLISKSSTVGTLVDVYNGTKPYCSNKGTPPQTKEILATKPYTSTVKVDESFTPLIGGSSFHRYRLLWNGDSWIKYGHCLAEPRDPKIFEAPEKLIFRQTGDSIIGNYITDGYTMRNNTHIVLPKDDANFDLKYLLAVLNSRLSNYFYWTINPEKGEALAEVKLLHLESLRVPTSSNKEQEDLSKLVTRMIEVQTEHLNLRRRFQNIVSSHFNLVKYPAKAVRWWAMDFPDIAKAIKPKMTMSDRDELLKLIELYGDQAAAQTQEIVDLDASIDAQVYALFNLTDEEILIIESRIQ